MKHYELKIQLKHVTKPPVWRKVRVASDYTFEDLHNVIQLAMDWEGFHLHHFMISKPNSGSLLFIVMEDEMEMEMGGGFSFHEPICENEVTLDKYLKKVNDKIIYEYDFGDSWEHEITLEAIKDFDKNLKTPFVLSGKGCCPPEDCGGAGGYESLKEALANPKAEDHEEAREWMGLEDDEDEFDPAYFDLEEINYDLVALFERTPLVTKNKKGNKSLKSVGNSTKTSSKKSTKQIFVNFTNHPSSAWSKKQLDAAKKFGEVIDIPFPVINPADSPEDLIEIADEYIEKIMATGATSIHIMGEMNFTFLVLLAFLGIGTPCYASTSERNIVMTKDGKKEVSFEFVQFRLYGASKMLEML